MIGEFTENPKESTEQKTSVDSYSDYNKYIAEKLNDVIKYNDYVSENMNKSISYSEYIAENVNNMLKYSDYLKDMTPPPSKLPNFKNTPPPPPPPPVNKKYNPYNFSTQSSEEYRIGVEKGIRHEVSDTTNSIKIIGISFDEELMKFLNWDNLDAFIKNIDTLEAVGRGSDKLTVVKFTNEKSEEVLVSIKNDHFSVYDGRIEPFYSEVDESEKKLSELAIKINEKEIELQKLNVAEIIEIDNNTLDLISDYTKKVKNYFNDNLSDANSLDLEKSNMKTLMEADILKI